MSDTLPREKLLQVRDPKKMETKELMSILIGHGTQKMNVFDLSNDLVEFIRCHISENITIDDLVKMPGIGTTKAMQIVSALELGRRFKWMTEKMKVHNVGSGQIIHGDCLDVMQTLPNDIIILGFTSPPYHNAINYDEHIDKIKGNISYWERKDGSYEYYKSFIVDRFKELYRITTPGGHNIVNIAPVSWEGKRIALPFHFLCWMEEIGWQFKEDIIWEKEIAKDRRSGVLMQHPYPGYYYPSLVSEYILVLQKPADNKKLNNIYHFRSHSEKKANSIDLSEYQGEMSKNVWKIPPVAPQSNLHPCPFPIELADRIIKLYSYRNDIVIDIFAGSGQTNLAAEKLGRKHIGIETKAEYVSYAVDRLTDYIKS